MSKVSFPYGKEYITHDFAKGKKRIVIIAGDHTRPVPSKIIIPPILER